MESYFPESLSGRLYYLKNYFYRVKYGSGPVEHCWAYFAAHFLENVHAWFLIESWRKLLTVKRLLNVCIVLLVFALWVSVLIRVLLNYEELTVAQIAEGISFFVGGFISFFSSVRLFLLRGPMTRIIRAVDKKISAIPLGCDEFRTKYVNEGLWFFTFVSLGCFQGLPAMFYMIITGKLYYQAYHPLSEEPYSFQWWLNFLYQGGNATYSGILFTMKEFIWISLICDLAMLFEIQRDILSQLWVDEKCNSEEEYRKLIGVIKEVQELKGILNQHKEMISPYLFNWYTTVYLMLTLLGVGFLLTYEENGFLNTLLQCIFLPFYILLMGAMWCFACEWLTESVESLDSALYKCNWLAAPPHAKKLILLYKDNFVHPEEIKGGSYFIFKWETFGNIIKKVYYLMTLLMEKLKKLMYERGGKFTDF